MQNHYPCYTAACLQGLIEMLAEVQYMVLNSVQKYLELIGLTCDMV